MYSVSARLFTPPVHIATERSFEKRIVFVNGYVRRESIKEDTFADKYLGTKPPAKRYIHSMGQKLRQTGSVANMKISRPRSLRTSEVGTFNSGLQVALENLLRLF